MATHNNDEIFRQQTHLKAKPALYIKESHIRALDEDAKSLNISRNTLLECIIAKHIRVYAGVPEYVLSV